MTPTASLIALMAAQLLPADNGAPEWVHLVPAGDSVHTFDGRGPYRVPSAETVIAASAGDPRGLPIDESHAIDIAAPKGLPAPARGWIVELQARQDGIWGRVEWTVEGAALVAGRAYRALSPVLAISAADRTTVLAIRRASLVNVPNLRGLTALQQESAMTLMERLIEKLGLKPEATEDDVLAAIAAATAKSDDEVPALQSALTEIGVALGVTNGDRAAILTAARGASGAKPAEITALQSQLASVTTELNGIKAQAQKSRAETFVDGEIARGRVGVLPLRDHYITRHMADPASVEKELMALPVLGGPAPAVLPRGGEITALNADQSTTARLLGIPEDKFLATLKAEQEAR